jgi:hypothetical protein
MDVASLWMIRAQNTFGFPEFSNVDMKKDITDFVQHYRLALRHIWNHCIWSNPNLRTWDSVYSFRELKVPLFKVVVADPLDIECDNSIFGFRFEVAPPADGSISLLRTNIRQPSSPLEGVWNVVTGPFESGAVCLTLIDLFDFSPLGYIDLRYYVVLIEALDGHPDKVGQHALVDTTEVNVLLRDISSGERSTRQ